MTKEDLKRNYPNISIVRDPVSDCPVCAGAGTVRPFGSNRRPCICTVITSFTHLYQIREHVRGLVDYKR